VDKIANCPQINQQNHHHSIITTTITITIIVIIIIKVLLMKTNHQAPTMQVHIAPTTYDPEPSSIGMRYIARLLLLTCAL
jgi:hypothetical protein